MYTIFLKFLILALCIAQFSCKETEKRIDISHEFPFTSEHWTVENADGTEAEITIKEFKGKPGIALKASQIAYLKSGDFKNFEMEFYCNGAYPGLGFRIQDKKNYEYLYLRVPSSTKKDALQYIPIYKGSLPWQLYNYPQYEGKATFPFQTVGAFPTRIADELIDGKLNQKLLDQFTEQAISLSSEAEVIRGEESSGYIFDPHDSTALLFDKVNERIEFSDFRIWIHIKLEVVEDEISVYVEDMETPSFIVTNLKRNTASGGISLISDFGEVYFRKVQIAELEEAKDTGTKVSSVALSKNYLTQWQLSEMFTKDTINFVAQLDSVLVNGKFKSIEADDDALVNISRFYDDMTKTVVLRHTLESDADRQVRLNFDYADHLAIFLNSEVLFDKGMDFQPPSTKGMEGRVFVDDEEVSLNLKKGQNTLCFMLSADNRQKFNWGVIAKLESLKGITSR